MNESTRSQLKLIDGDRAALEQRLLHLCLSGPSDEFRAALDAFMRRGKLTLVKPSGTHPPYEGYPAQAPV
jgi:hypothetical protein